RGCGQWQSFRRAEGFPVQIRCVAVGGIEHICHWVINGSGTDLTIDFRSNRGAEKCKPLHKIRSAIQRVNVPHNMVGVGTIGGLACRCRAGLLPHYDCAWTTGANNIAPTLFGSPIMLGDLIVWTTFESGIDWSTTYRGQVSIG